ncbi:MAG: response regulator transcription factor [Dehalococcoidia bacterium]|nr:response regulator transcription factor [Dehalococcoidia bacterium]
MTNAQENGGSSELASENVFRSGDLTIDFSRCRVTIRGQQISLSATEYKLLTCLARNAGSVVTQDQLVNEVWGSSSLGDKELLYVNLCRIRLKMGDNARESRFIIANRGFGYMLSDRG